MSNAQTKVIAAVSGVVLVLAAGSLGFGTAWITKPAEVQTVEVEVPVEVENEETKDELAKSQEKVSELERTVATKEHRVNELEEKIRKGAIAGKALREELASLKKELAETKEALAVAIEEKEEVLEQLRLTTEQLEQTEEQLAKVTVQRDEAREDALFNRWQDFVKGAQLSICDRGGRKKLGNCREAVTAAIMTTEREARFAHCLRSGQAQPTVREEQKGTDMPEFSEMMNEDTRQTRGWYIEFCDPTLPENANFSLAEGSLAQNL